MPSRDYVLSDDARDRIRARSDDRAYDRLERKMAAAERLIGRLCREGQEILYINIRKKSGELTGRVREFTGGMANAAAIDYLIRNRYV